MHKKRSFPLRISSVKVTKSAVSLENLIENLIFCAVKAVLKPLTISMKVSSLIRIIQLVRRQFSVKTTFLSPWYTHVRVCIGGKKCKLFGKFCVLNRWMIPYLPGFYVSLCWTIFPTLQVSITCFSKLLTTQNVHKIQKTYWYSPWSTSKSHVTWRKN